MTPSLHIRNSLAKALPLLLCACIASAACAQTDGIQTVPLNAESFRIGDSVSDPVPVGTTWEVKFQANPLPKWAYLTVEASEASAGNTVWINDAQIGVLDSVPTGVWATTALVVPASVLLLGENRLELRSVAKGSNYDDFKVRNVALLLGYTEPPAIQALSRTQGKAGTTVVATGERFDPEISRLWIGDRAAPCLFSSPNQAVFRIPADLEPGTYPVTAQFLGALSQPVQFTVLAGDPAYNSLPVGEGESCGLAGDVAPRRGPGGKAGDGVINLADAIRLLRRAVGLEPDPWP